MHFHIDPDITKAETLPASFYRSREIFELLKERVFYRSWQWVGHESEIPLPRDVYPKIILEDFLTEPVVLTRESNLEIHCLSNVCTHRGNTVVQQTGNTRKLTCNYHGRRFTLDGRFEHMPEFGLARNFPRPCDDLPSFPLRSLGPFLFAGFQPHYDFREVTEAMMTRIGFMPLENFMHDASRTKNYLINAHWALYCDNYLEGFHIPFVHEDLNAVLDYGNYDTVLDKYMNVQIGYAEGTDAVFDLPEGHVDYGKKVAAYYFWIFPNMMFNFYPWGLSVNLVQPQGLTRTKVTFLSYVYDPARLDQGAGSGLDKVEMEDEAVVESVQKGVRSRFYQAGRFSPTREKGVHHFHRLLASFLNYTSPFTP